MQEVFKIKALPDITEEQIFAYQSRQILDSDNDANHKSMYIIYGRTLVAKIMDNSMSPYRSNISTHSNTP